MLFGSNLFNNQVFCCFGGPKTVIYFYLTSAASHRSTYKCSEAMECRDFRFEPGTMWSYCIVLLAEPPYLHILLFLQISINCATYMKSSNWSQSFLITIESICFFVNYREKKLKYNISVRRKLESLKSPRCRQEKKKKLILNLELALEICTS
jgi:hypothetical protein